MMATTAQTDQRKDPAASEMLKAGWVEVKMRCRSEQCIYPEYGAFHPKNQ